MPTFKNLTFSLKNRITTFKMRLSNPRIFKMLMAAILDCLV